MDLSVIIVSFNVRDYLNQCLSSVKRASEKIDCEIFVIDNNSLDGSADMVRQEFPDIHLITNKTNSGYSAASNQGINLSDGEFVLLLNPDTLVEEDSFVKCISFMRNHSEAGALGVRMVNGDGRYLPESKRGFPSPGTAFFKVFGFAALFPGSKMLNRYYLSEIDSFETSPSQVISGAFMFLRKEVFLKVGLPDEDFFMYGEDIDLSYRILKAGYKNYYFPEVQIIHYKGKSTSRKDFTDVLHFYSAMRIYVRKRHKEKFNILYFIIIPAIYFREAISLCSRFFRIVFFD